MLQVEDKDEHVLGQGVATVNTDNGGQAGLFEGEVTFENPTTASDGRIALYAEDPATGELMLLAWVNVRLAGAKSGRSAHILVPEQGAGVSGSVVVSGTASNVTDNIVLVRVEDLSGSVWGQARAKTNAVDASSTGNWEVKLKVQQPPTGRAGRYRGLHD